MHTSKRTRFARSAAIGLLSCGTLLAAGAVAFAQAPRIHLPPGRGTAVATATATASAPATPSTTIAAAGQTSDQKIRLSQYVDKTNTLIHSSVHAGGKAVTDDERKAVSAHWRLSMRLLRCRDVASDVGDQASVSLVDQDLAALDANFATQLKALNAKAPK